MAQDWKDSLREVLPADTIPAYRHDLSFVTVSSIAQQFYCEAKVEKGYVFGEILSEEKDTGTELHEQILAMEAVKHDELIGHIKHRPTVADSFPSMRRSGPCLSWAFRTL